MWIKNVQYVLLCNVKTFLNAYNVTSIFSSLCLVVLSMHWYLLFSTVCSIKKKSVKKVQKIREIADKIDTKNAYKKCNFHNEAVTLHFFRCSKVYLKFQFFIYFNALRDYSSLLWSLSKRYFSIVKKFLISCMNLWQDHSKVN